MRRFLIAAASFVAMGGTALAAAPIFTWTGFYLGVNAGYGWSNDNRDRFLQDAISFQERERARELGLSASDEALLSEAFLDDGQDRGDGFIGGGQIGYMWQFGAPGATSLGYPATTPFGGLVFGVEADIQAVRFGENDDDDEFFLEDRFFGNILVPRRNTLDYFGTVRGIVGVPVFEGGRGLIYGTGGFAFGGGDGGRSCFTDFCHGGDDTRTGYTVGGGFKYALSDTITFKLEGLYVNLDSDDNSRRFPGDFGSDPEREFGRGFRGDDDFLVARFGIDFRFR